MTLGTTAIVGAGRVGLTLARALLRSGSTVHVLVRAARPAASALPPFQVDWNGAVRASSLILLAVPDDAIEIVAERLAASGQVTSTHAVLHCSGLRDRNALRALEGSGAALGSFHPLQTFTAPDGDPTLLAETPAILEGDPRAVGAGRVLAETLGMSPAIELPSTGKARYHAAAVFASNYLVVLAGIAAELAAEAGAGEAASALFRPIMQRTLANIETGGVVAALSGPVRRGDLGTVARHLGALQGDHRDAYLVLAREALGIAREAGLDERVALQMERLLTAE